jgi:threonine/homoserine/homoserine lactone efflux protein
VTGLGIDHLWLFVAAGIALNLTPGPDVFYIVTHGIRSGARAGVTAAAGITAGCFVHIFAAAAGVSALIAASATAFTVLKWAGAAYLVYVGLTMLLARRNPNAPEFIANNALSAGTPGDFSLKKVFLQGFWTNALNPKVAIFFLAFVPQFISPQAAHPSLAFLALGLLFNFNGFFVNAAYGLLAAWVAQRVGAIQRGMAWLERAAGALFVSFGIQLALSHR